MGTAVSTLPVLLARWTMDATFSDLRPPVNHSTIVNAEVRVACYYWTQTPKVGSLTGAHVIKTIFVGLFRWDFWVAFLEQISSDNWTFFFCLFSELWVDITGMVQVIFYLGTTLIQPPTEIMKSLHGQYAQFYQNLLICKFCWVFFYIILGCKKIIILVSRKCPTKTLKEIKLQKWEIINFSTLNVFWNLPGTLI